jgi:hypothetical protein
LKSIGGSHHLERFHSRYENELMGSRGKFLMLMTLTQLTLEELASDCAQAAIKEAMEDCRRRFI